MSYFGITSIPVLVPSGFQSMNGCCLTCFTEVNIMCVPQNSPLVLTAAKPLDGQPRATGGGKIKLKFFYFVFLSAPLWPLLSASSSEPSLNQSEAQNLGQVVSFLWKLSKPIRASKSRGTGSNEAKSKGQRGRCCEEAEKRPRKGFSSLLHLIQLF